MHYLVNRMGGEFASFTGPAAGQGISFSPSGTDRDAITRCTDRPSARAWANSLGGLASAFRI